MKTITLFLVAISGIMTYSGYTVNAMQTSKKIQVDNVSHFSSTNLLKEKFRNTNLTHQIQEISFKNKKYFWVWLDEGSGVSIIRGFLYESNKDQVRLMMYIPPESGVIALDAQSQSDAIRISAFYQNDYTTRVPIVDVHPKRER